MRRIFFAATLLAAACSKDGRAAPAPGAPTAAPAAPAAPAAKEAPPGSLNICEIMPAAKVSEITGTKFEKAERDDTPSYHLFACNYTSGPPTPNQLRVSIVGKNGKPGFENGSHALKEANRKVEPVAGIGDAAYTSDGPWCLLTVLYGDVELKVTGWDKLTVDQAKLIVSGIHDKM